MSAIKLRENLWSVGVLNPSLRVFDIVMESKFGTSYNAYLLTGEKNVLIETVHTDYFDEYLDNIRQVIPVEDVDYLIMNHNEPDHSGSVAKLMAVCPKLEVIATKAGKKHLQDITNLDLPCRTVAAGDTLDLGDRVLEFIPAPMLHWADSMFTWDSKGKTLFTCDFLGCHFCEPTMLDKNIHAKEAYEGEFAYYYAGIFGPFKPSVLSGLDKMPADVELVCPSHGPCLTETIARAKELYRTWSTPAPKTRRTAFVVYASAYGCTAALAAKIRDGVLSVLPSAECKTYNIIDFDLATLAAELNGSNAFAIGSPTLNADAVPPVWNLIASIDAINIKKRPVAVFGSYGWSGEAVPALVARLTALKLNVVGEGLKACFVPSEAELAKAFELGAMLAQSIA